PVVGGIQFEDDLRRWIGETIEVHINEAISDGFFIEADAVVAFTAGVSARCSVLLPTSAARSSQSQGIAVFLQIT
ncbi:MAG: hypothetical protein EA384_00260, partial [Spirochaetaceae bacterium]